MKYPRASGVLRWAPDPMLKGAHFACTTLLCTVGNLSLSRSGLLPPDQILDPPLLSNNVNVSIVLPPTEMVAALFGITGMSLLFNEALNEEIKENKNTRFPTRKLQERLYHGRGGFEFANSCYSAFLAHGPDSDPVLLCCVSCLLQRTHTFVSVNSTAHPARLKKKVCTLQVEEETGSSCTSRTL